MSGLPLSKPFRKQHFLQYPACLKAVRKAECTNWLANFSVLHDRCQG